MYKINTNIWFCKKGTDSHNALYTNFNDAKYFPKCVPQEIQEHSVLITETHKTIL